MKGALRSFSVIKNWNHFCSECLHNTQSNHSSRNRHSVLCMIQHDFSYIKIPDYLTFLNVMAIPFGWSVSTECAMRKHRSMMSSSLPSSSTHSDMTSSIWISDVKYIFPHSNVADDCPVPPLSVSTELYMFFFGNLKLESPLEKIQPFLLSFTSLVLNREQRSHVGFIV